MVLLACGRSICKKQIDSSNLNLNGLVARGATRIVLYARKEVSMTVVKDGAASTAPY